jgi:hypothetical protein
LVEADNGLADANVEQDQVGGTAVHDTFGKTLEP